VAISLSVGLMVAMAFKNGLAARFSGVIVPAASLATIQEVIPEQMPNALREQ
jgi:hypothetical protein